MREHRTSKMSGNVEPIYPSAAHWILGMSHEEVLADMASRGETAEDALASFDRVLARARALYLGQSDARQAPSPREAAPIAIPAPSLVANRVHPSLVDDLAFHEELVCAGRGLGDADAGLRRATLGDFFGKQDWDVVVAARISGCSMEDDHIKDGDLVLVDTHRAPRDGDIVLVHLVGRGQLVKRLRTAGPLRLILESGNSEFDSIVVDDPSTLTIHGVVVGRSGKV